MGGKRRVLRDIVKALRRPHRFARCRFARCRFARATGTAASQGFRTAHGFETGRRACDAPHRRAMRSWPKTLGNRLYGSLSALLGICAQKEKGRWRRLRPFPSLGALACEDPRYRISSIEARPRSWAHRASWPHVTDSYIALAAGECKYYFRYNCIYVQNYF